MNDTSMPIRPGVSSRRKESPLSMVVPMLLCFSLGFVLAITSNAKFPNFYLPFLPPLPSASVSSPSPPPLLFPPSPPPPALQPPPPPPTPSTSLSSVKRNNMTDEELFWLASMSPKVRATPYHRVPKVAFLFLARGDLPLRPLWEKFFEGHDGLYSIYVHADPSYTGSPPDDSVFYNRMIPSQNTSWGDVTLVDAARRLVANALLDVGNQRFALVSESCIPLYNFTTVYALLTGSNTSFVDSFFNHHSDVRWHPYRHDDSTPPYMF
ncbi:hypothetical protein SORBI_3010G070400 [Sorghum bicolor]|uniref:Uncharacterized protein n=1 Tax=Sorghum bicolor TaxID=4558 RepID=A0A1W0VRS8_SORBI|nr:hypothetical protein SORBI_3010G070400 [Sorghum bicolor]OQU75988.1 hypothetical protein SORBI_3010G070400 [Sorghum bicolor]OQU75989.1 hypothetical protein SORBI_3010G070400 [Sorghum bicolor]